MYSLLSLLLTLCSFIISSIITNHLSIAQKSTKRSGYAINLDPAAKYIPFNSSIDIRDTVDYIEVMKQHKLGPNGAILTCLNLFATKFDQVMSILERRAFPPNEEEVHGDDDADVDVVVGGSDGGDEEKVAASNDGGTGALKKSSSETDETEQVDNSSSNSSNNSKPSDGDDDVDNTKCNEKSTSNTTTKSSSSPLDYVLIDTPGQIEAFTWSASGTIVTSALATTFPTVLAFVIDTPRCAASVHTFMSNMLYACSMLYRAKLPMVIVLNKIDVVGCEFVKEWMEDYESFQEALDDASSSTNGYSDEMAGGGGGSGYYASLTRSLSLVLDEFYNHLHKVGVSAATGEGVDEFWDVVQQAAEEYETGYLVDLKNRVEEQQAKERAMQRVGARKLVRDLQQDGQL